MKQEKQIDKNLEEQFQELFDKAKQLYPDIEDAVYILNNITAETADVRDYLNLTMQTPAEISNNRIE